MHNTGHQDQCSKVLEQLNVISLSALLEDNDCKTPAKVSGVLSGFICSKNVDEEDFIRNKAINFERTNKARTYLVAYDGEIVAFFSLAFKSIDLSGVSLNKVKKMTAGEKVSAYPAFLIGHLAKKDGFICPIMNILLDMAMDIVKEVQSAIGGRLVYLDCKDEKKLFSMYESYGFKYFRTSEESGLRQYYMKI